jgi:hypothetical protein
MILFCIFIFLVFFLSVERIFSFQENFSLEDPYEKLSKSIQSSHDTMTDLNKKLASVDFKSSNKNVKRIPLLDLKKRSTLEAVGDLISALPQIIANHNYATSST